MILRPRFDHEINQEWADQLASDIQQNGILLPIKVTPDGTVIDGNHRVAAARMLGIADEDIPRQVVEDARV